MPDEHDPLQDRVPHHFREVNDEIVRLAVAAGTADGLLAVLCECGDADCATEVEIAHAEYQLARGAPGRFIFSTGHEPADVVIIASSHGYVVGQR